MIDYLIRLDDKPTFDNIALAEGLAVLDEDTGEIQPTLATYTYAQVIIGEHFIPTGNNIPGPNGEQIPEMISDGSHWVMFRELEPVAALQALNPYVEWASNWVNTDGNPVPRPTYFTFPHNVWL